MDLKELYFTEKDIFQRYKILKELVLVLPEDSKDFFLKAFKKERFLDMKLCAVRGYAAFATEIEVSILMNKMCDLLQKRADKTPFNYTEYEPMRSVFLIPYLLEHYSYECFHRFSLQLETQYAAMPDCFKNIFTLDKHGNIVQLRNAEEVKQSLQHFLSTEHNTQTNI